MNPSFCRLLLLVAGLPLILLGQGRTAAADTGWSQSLTAGFIQQGDTDITGGGSYSLTRVFVGADFSRLISKTESLGFGLGYGRDSYDFSKAVAPWGDISRYDASLSYARRLEDDWTVFLSPSVEMSGENGASAEDGLVLGLIAVATRNLIPTLQLGLGAGVFTGLEETKVFPFLSIRWKISEAWTLQNPFRPGPAGPAGIELMYRVDTWELAIGGAYRSFRFKLAEDNLVPSGIGETSGIPLFFRASRNLSPKWQIDLYVGATVAGQLKLADKSGHTLSKRDFDPAPLAALSLSGKF